MKTTVKISFRQWANQTEAKLAKLIGNIALLIGSVATALLATYLIHPFHIGKIDIQNILSITLAITVAIKTASKAIIPKDNVDLNKNPE